MLLWLKKNHCRLLAGILMGCSLMFLNGCITMRTIESSDPITIDRTYKVDAVESAGKLPNGDIVLSVKGRLTAGEAEKTSSFALLISAKDIQAAIKWDKERQKTTTRVESLQDWDAWLNTIPAIRCETQAGESGASFMVIQNIAPKNVKPIMGSNAAVVLVRDIFPNADAGFYSRMDIVYIEQRDDGSLFQARIMPDAKDIQKSRRLKLLLLPVTIAGDVVTLPFQAVLFTIAVVYFGKD